jgi:hypothetical protein
MEIWVKLVDEITAGISEKSLNCKFITGFWL